MSLFRRPRIQPPRRRWIPGAVASADVTVALTGQSLALAQGTLTPSTSVAIAGQALTLSAGTLIPALSLTPSGQQLSISPGTLSPALDKALSGSALTLSSGTLAPDTSITLAGQQLTVATGTLTVLGDITVALTGLSLSFAQGTLGVVAPSADFSGGFLYEFERHMARRSRRRRELEDAEAAIQALVPVEKEIGEFLQKQERLDEERNELQRLSKLVDGFEADEIMNERVMAAWQRAHEQMTTSALLAFERALRQQLEEEEYAVLMALLED